MRKAKAIVKYRKVYNFRKAKVIVKYRKIYNFNKTKAIDSSSWRGRFQTQAKKKNVCLLSHVKKICFFLFFVLLLAKPEIVVPESDSGISFLKFPVSCFMMSYTVFLPSLLSISTKS